ncbi:MAG: phycocyanobilin:ferredoxin oxidoreductase [Cyanobacteria bacterium J06597_16]
MVKTRHSQTRHSQTRHSQTHHKNNQKKNTQKTLKKAGQKPPSQTAQKRPNTAGQKPLSLVKQVHPAIAQLAGTITSIWHNQLMLFPYAIPTDLGYVEGSLEGQHLTIQNTCYQTFQFRKLHLELAKVGDTLDILHCVMFPHPCYELPIFGVDIVVAKGTITAAIVDLSPVSQDRTLPSGYEIALRELPAQSFEHPRDLPPWGSIFSDHCLFIRPTNAQEEQIFLSKVLQYLSLHCQLACEANIVQDKTARAAILAGQQHYCSQQQQNDKTRRILERAFDAQWAQQYLETMLFDCVVNSNNPAVM